MKVHRFRLASDVQRDIATNLHLGARARRLLRRQVARLPFRTRWLIVMARIRRRLWQHASSIWSELWDELGYLVRG